MPTPVSDFDYILPPEHIAQEPTYPRDSSRLLVIRRSEKGFFHGSFRDILEELRAGDVLVFNTSKVFRARFVSPDRKVEMFVLRIREGEIEVLLRPGKKFEKGSVVVMAGKEFEVKEKEQDGVAVMATGMSAKDMLAFCEEHGEIPTPPYVSGEHITDTQYQTVYAKESGSVAAPTAGLHFTPELLDEIRQKGVEIVEVILHVGIGTFRPVQSDIIEDHRMHAEFVELTDEAAASLVRAKSEGRRVIAVGTTTTRVLEGIVSTQGELKAFSGDINIFITPGFTFRVIDGLLTNFHLPKSTLLMLVSAFAGRDRVLAAYKEAIALEYRFFSFGDAMLII